MTEDELLGLAKGLCHLYNIYKKQQTPEGKERKFNLLKAYSFSFAQACNRFYNEEKTAGDWLRFFGKKIKKENSLLNK